MTFDEAIKVLSAPEVLEAIKTLRAGAVVSEIRPKAPISPLGQHALEQSRDWLHGPLK